MHLSAIFLVTLNLSASVPEGAFTSLHVKVKDVDAYINYMKENTDAFKMIDSDVAGVCVVKTGNEYPGEMFVWNAFPSVEKAFMTSELYDPMNAPKEFNKLRKVLYSVTWKPIKEFELNPGYERLWRIKTSDVRALANDMTKLEKELQKILHEESIFTEFIPNHEDALRLIERANVFRTEAFKNGYFEVQDASSQLVAEYLDVEPGMKVIDTCAGAGGKTLHLASFMKNKGQIIAMDIYESKLRKLKVRARRNKVHNIDTRVIDSTKPIKKLHGKADRVLIDAPCSGLGVLRRNPDSKWKLQPEFLENIKKVQQEILQQYAKMVKQGGKLVYATCSVLPSENQNQIVEFLASESGKDFRLVKDNKVLAHTSGFDGFYMAQLERK